MPKQYGSPNMSDQTLLVSVEDLINMAMGPPDVNVVNFKMIQTVLHILARQLRMLETNVEIRISETPTPKERKEKKKMPEPPSTDSSSSKSPRKVSPPPKPPLKEIKEERTQLLRDRDKERADKAAAIAREKEAKMTEKAEKEREKARRADERDRERTGRAQSKDRDKAERAESRERDRAERAESRERGKAERAKEKDRAERAAMKDKAKSEREASREREKADKSAIKDKEKAERAESKEREKAEKSAIKDKEKSERAESRERDKEARAETKEREKEARAESKEREKGARAESRERDKAERAESREREKAGREQDKLAKMDAKDREKTEKEKEKLAKMDAKDKEKADREQEKLTKMDAKEREKAERELEKLAKMDAKGREKAEREQEKLAKMDAKDREKAERELEKLAKMDAKDREKAERERDKLAKMDAKDRERVEKEKDKADRDAAKEKEKLEKMSAKERQKYEKELALQNAKMEKERAKSAKAGITVKEKDKVLIVEKGPTTRSDSRTRVGSIEIVTVSQFALLEAVVKDLKSKAGPLPFPALPDNQKLRSELAKGSASLTDTMQAMQVTARLQAAETAIGRMAGLLTQLAAAGALPKDVAGKLEDVKAEMDAITEESVRTRPSSGPTRKSVAIDPMSKKGSTTSRVEARPSSVGVRPSIISGGSAVSKFSIGASGVTHTELDDALRSLKDDLTKNVNNLTTKATVAAESASAMAKSVAEKLDVALKLNTRINTLYSLVTDYAEQLNGFDAGLTTQMQSFREQMAQMRNDLKGGITLLETANNNAETAAVMELTERYDGLVVELDNTLHAHQSLTVFQKQLAEELHSLLECVEMLREQKADRDEVLDGLRDKADNSRLAGLLTEVEFASSRTELERRLDLCYDKFQKQEQVWMGAVKDLTMISEGKAEIMQLLAARDDAQQQLRAIQDRLQKLAIILGEPKAAMLTRQLSRGARCGACQIPALQEPTDSTSGKPPKLPAARPTPLGEERPCVPEWLPDRPPDDREHTCHRWVGGSHTLLVDSVVREEAAPMQILSPPTKRYAGYGTDGRLYMMEEELQPCVECNTISTETDKIPGEPKDPEGTAPADGAGDTGNNKTTMMLPINE